MLCLCAFLLRMDTGERRSGDHGATRPPSEDSDDDVRTNEEVHSEPESDLNCQA